MEGLRVCDSYLHGFGGAQVTLLSDMAQDAGAPGRPPLAIPDAQLRRLLECPDDRALVAEELEAGLQTWHGRLRPGEAAAVP
eukprot:2644316-Alexandrium_andersonii.AAC.1